PVAAPLPVVPAQVEVAAEPEPVSASAWVEAAEKKPAWSFRRAAAEAEVEQTSVLPAIREPAGEAPRTGGRRRAEDRKSPVLPGWARPFGRKGAETPAPRKRAAEDAPVRAVAAEEPVGQAQAAEPPGRRAKDVSVRWTDAPRGAESARGTQAEDVRSRRAETPQRPSRAPESAAGSRAADEAPVRRAETSRAAEKTQVVEDASVRWPEKPRAAEEAPARREDEDAPVRPLRAADDTKTPWAREGTPRRAVEEAAAEESPRFSLRMPDLSDILPELPLAPAPAEEAAAPLWESAEWAQEEAARRDSRGRKTRHDAEHGSVAAKSVLDRLGITATGGGGGRRRADEPGRAESAVAEAEAAAQDKPAQDKPELAPAPRPEEPEPVEEPWLPRLRMPPALDPLSDIDAWTPSEQPFPESYARAIAEDEPPPDAGLAELLARALAEHQAGTASAAALVKRLGPNDEPKPINGRATADRHHNNGD
ncbi:hypothetical protein ABT266_48800, partial [Amycolatopsis sp. NPDC000746]